MSSAPHSTGEWAGYASAMVLVLGALGTGIKWLIGSHRTARKSRASGLQDWEDKLSARETKLDDAVDQRLRKLEIEGAQRLAESQALRLSFEIVANALRLIDPKNTALSRAEQLLASAFPLTPIVPPEMGVSLKQIDQGDLAATAANRRTEGVKS